MKYLLPLILLLIAAGVSHAQLNETPAQVEAVFGAPVSKTAVEHNISTAAYKFNGQHIGVVFLHGQSSHAVTLVKDDKSGYSDAEIKAILKPIMNTEWVASSEQLPGVKQQWTLSMNGAVAANAYYIEGNAVIMETVKLKDMLKGANKDVIDKLMQ